MVVEVRVKKWGNSFGIVLPKMVVEKENLRENDKIFVNIIRGADFTDVFGSLKTNITGQKFKDEVRKGWK